MDLTKMKRALQLNAQAYDQVKKTLRTGMTELELLRIIEETYTHCAGRKVNYSYDLVSGPRSGAIQGPATNRVMQTGDCVIIDLQIENEGVWCDTTRTFFIGQPEEYWHKAYAAVLSSIREGEAYLQSGIPATEIYRRVSGCIEHHGFSPLPHHAGHAVGKAKLEAPSFLPDNEDTLQQAVAVTLEPGIYMEGKNGIRLENNYYIAKEGFIPLFEYPENMDYFIIL